MRFDLVDLRLFLDIYRGGSITQGAARSNLTLQSASERIRGMESELGAPLLTRSKRGVTLTDAGYALANHAHIVLEKVANMRGELQHYGKGLRAHIDLLCNASAHTEYLPEALGPYLRARPTISIAVKEMPSAAIVAAIHSQAASLGIVADSTELQGLATMPFRHDDLVALVPSDSIWRDRDSVPFDELMHAEFIGLTEGNALQDHLDEHAKKLGHRLHYRLRLATFDGVMQIVGHGVGVAIVPRRAAERHASAHGATILRLPERWAGRKLLICARDFSDLPEYVRELIDFIAAPVI